MKRGEIWTVAGASDYAGKPRPVVIVQSDHFDATESISVCGLTSNSLDLPLFRIPIVPNATNGLRVTSRIMADKITTVPRSKLGQRIGELDRRETALLDRAIVVFLGLADVSKRPGRHAAS